jgi:proline dehydrogenase
MIPPIATQFVAGEDASAALDRADELADDGIGSILNLLGEHYDRSRPAAADSEAYIDLVGAIGSSGRDDVRISVKPSQLGYDVSPDTFRKNLDHIVEAAAANDVFVWIDMEDHTTTDDTLDAYEDLAAAHNDVGVCVQSNLRRTRDDLERLADVPGTVRLVKGAYDPPHDVAYKDRERVNRAYREDLAYAFREFDGGVAVGSHDDAMIDHALALHDEYGTDFEVQMLMGVREDRQRELAREGVDVWQYVPYGNRWPSYFYRRIRERKENLLFAARAVVG